MLACTGLRPPTAHMITHAHSRRSFRKFMCDEIPYSDGDVRTSGVSSILTSRQSGASRRLFPPIEGLSMYIAVKVFKHDSATSFS